MDKKEIAEAGKNSRTDSYFLRFAQSQTSLLELCCVKESRGNLDFEIEYADDSGALIVCTEETARSVIGRLGGSYKVARVLGRDLLAAVKELPLPYESKFNWTVSSYSCDSEALENAKDEVRESLKLNELGKSKYLAPDFEQLARNQGANDGKKGYHRGVSDGAGSVSELRISELNSRVFQAKESGSDLPQGIDFIVHGGISGSGPFFAHTIALSDVGGFEKRDFGRPFQDPTITISPRLARLVVNTAAPAIEGCLLDPFCGLGTILQEAMMIGLSVVGIDKQSEYVFKTKSNLNWMIKQYNVKNARVVKLARYDAARINEVQLPRIACVASEPILLPTFERNPTAEIARMALNKSREIYRATMAAMARVLSHGEGHVALISPTLFDAEGRKHTLFLEDLATEAGLRPYWPKSLRKRFQYPLRLETSKKKIVQRDLNLFSSL